VMKRQDGCEAEGGEQQAFDPNHNPATERGLSGMARGFG
jgi:hypothetical protein